ncbi:MAG: outer membrane beta-barrel protein [Hyphomonadaceae bacterium]|nr:outer membrane beta-barrel protein [Hyphomonadaceae bacterium]
MKLGLKHLLLTTALVGVLAPVASAQDNPFLRGRHVAVTDRAQPEYDPEPIQVGSFNIASNLLAAAEFNDNVFGTPTNTVEDTIIRIRPEVVATSTWSVHALSVGANVDHREYTGEGSETSTDYNLFANGRLDATRNLNFTANASTGQSTEPRYEPGSQGSPEPAQNQYLAADIGATFRSDRLLLQARVGTRDNDYQSFYAQRDSVETSVSGRVSYAISPDLAVFGEVSQTDYEYDQSIINRDGSQLAYRAGVSFELSAPFRGEIAVGQVTDERDAPGVADSESLSLDAAVYWFPTQLTTLTFRGFAGITDPGITEALSADTQRYSVRADHELLRNVLLFGEFGFGNYKFNAAPGFPLFDREDKFFDAAVGAAYKLNKHARVEVGYRMRTNDTSGVTSYDIDQNVISVGLRVFP